MLRKWPILGVILLVINSIMACATAEAAVSKKSYISQAPSSSGSKIAGNQQNCPKAFTGDSSLKHLQQLLADTGFYPGEMSGKLDKTTKDAIAQAQRTFKLAPTGQYDPKLADLLTREAHSKPHTYRKKLSMQATAYTSQDPGCGNLTKREHRLRPGLVAVDPKVIPLGTRLYIESYGYAVADDIGRAIKGAKIDLAYANRKEALIFGRKMVTVFVLD